VRVPSRLFDQQIYWSQQQGLVYPTSMRLGQLDSDAARSENASSAPAAHIPGQKVEVPIKVCLGSTIELKSVSQDEAG
jgi:hypothetical protein